MSLDTEAARRVVDALIPDTMTFGRDALRAIADQAIKNYAAEVDAPGVGPGDRHTFLPTSDGQLDRINDPAALESFRSAYGLRPDWHEPDNEGVTAYIVGNSLDNAMGPTVDRNFGELNVVLTHEQTFNEIQGHVHLPIAVVNLATLLSWATDSARSDG